MIKKKFSMMIPPQCTVVELQNYRGGSKIDVRNIPGICAYTTNPFGEVCRICVDSSIPGANRALTYIENNKVWIIDKRRFNASVFSNKKVFYDKKIVFSK